MPGEHIPFEDQSERPPAVEPEAPKKRRTARGSRGPLAKGTTPPPFAAQKPPEEIEELPQAMLKAEPPETPGMSHGTQEALSDMQAHVADRIEEDAEWDKKKDMAEAAAAASDERKAAIEARSAGIAKAKQELEARNGAEIARLREGFAVKEAQAKLAHQAVDQLIAEDHSGRFPDMTEHAEPLEDAKPKKMGLGARIKAWFSKKS